MWQRKDAGSRKSKQPPNHRQTKPLPDQSAVRSEHQESDLTATKNTREKTLKLPKSLSVMNQPLMTTTTIIIHYSEGVLYPNFSKSVESSSGLEVEA